MERRKITKLGEVHLAEPMLCFDNKKIHKGFCYVKKINKEKLLIVEKDGKCYAKLISYDGFSLYIAIKEKFDDLDGETEAGGNAPEKEE